VSFLKITAAYAGTMFLIATPVFAQAPAQPTGRSDTTTEGGMKKSDMMKTNDMKPSMMNKGTSDHNGTDTLAGPAATKAQ